MSIISGILIFFWLIFIPFVLGRVLIKKDENTILYSWMFGIVFQMAIFYIIAIPMILLRKDFSLLWQSYSFVIGILGILAILVFHERIFEKPKFNKPKFFQIIAIILILIQLFVRIKYTNINNDDSSFMVLAKQMMQTGNMYTNSNDELNPRRALAPISAFYATLAKMTAMDSTILAHSIMPLIFISMSYIVYYNFSKRFFKDEDSPYILLIFLSFLYVYAFSVRGIARYIILYSWLGRAVLGCITFPLIWKTALEAMDKESNWKSWISLFMTVVASCLGSEMAVALVPISLGCLAITEAIKDKKISYLFKTVLCLLPCIIIGIIYMKIK